jgi:demethylmenaquinone methyltransferase/2-methoxy-6-polyprenyl-1,4-benzoquinol methylase
LSHVPPEHLGDFLDSVSQAVGIGGHVFIVDEPAGGKMLSGPPQDGMVQDRKLQDGREYKIYKVYYDPKDIQDELERRSFLISRLWKGDYFFYLDSTKTG